MAKRALSLRKKLLFSAIAVGAALLPLLALAEIGYRIKNAIPLTGGVLYEEDLRVAEETLRTKPWVAELLVRHRRSKNPILFYEPRPNYRDPLYSINADAYRDHAYPVAKEDGTIRIVTLGDSVIWGHGLPLEEVFAKQLERLLNARFSRTFEVLNFGVSGYGTQQEVETYRVRSHSYDPDIVIVGYCLNDYLRSSAEGDAFRHLYHDIFSKSYVLEELQTAVNRVAHDRLGLAVEDAAIQLDLRHQFELLQSYSEDRKRLILVFPLLVNFDAYPVAFEHDRVAGAVEGLDFELLDLLEHYRPHDFRTLKQNHHDTLHPNAKGVEIAARATMEFLIDRNMIPLE